MKISKLFHWLYAILMLLPILCWIPNILYFGFNESIDLQSYDDITLWLTSSFSDVMNSNLFGWAKDSFLVEPFQYIANLFEMPSTSPIIYALSYWLSISIIWLVFDVIMYVPLLVHRWLDKGIIE